jgi:hypothetical protein
LHKNEAHKTVGAEQRSHADEKVNGATTAQPNQQASQFFWADENIRTLLGYETEPWAVLVDRSFETQTWQTQMERHTPQ